GGMALPARATAAGEPLRPSPACLAPRTVRVCGLSDRSVVDRSYRCRGDLMSTVTSRPEPVEARKGNDGPKPGADNSNNARARTSAAKRIRLAPILITLATLAGACVLLWVTWQTYVSTPWTRDGTVRVYVVTVAPEVSGRIIKLPLADNQLVHK